MKKTIIAVSALFLTSTAYAGNFEGLSVFAKAASQSTNTEVKFTGSGDAAGESGKLDGTGRSRFVGGVGADYGIKMNDKFLTLIGVEANINNTNFYKDSSTDEDGTSSAKFKQKNTYGIYVAPGYMINDDALIYAKFSYNRTKAEAKFTEDGVSDKSSYNFDGFGFGVGARLFFAKNIFVNAEWQKIEYSRESKTFEDGKLSFKPETTVGTIAIGYNF
jgi:opacity protein-like surface antigen